MMMPRVVGRSAVDLVRLVIWVLSVVGVYTTSLLLAGRRRGPVV